MRITTSRCRTFDYTVTRPSPCAVGLGAVQLGSTYRFSDCLVATIEMEHGDRVLGSAVARAIRRIATHSDAAMIVIDGYLRPPSMRERESQGADLLTDLADALDLLTDINAQLSRGNDDVHVMPFGWHIRARADVLSGAFGQRSIQLGGGDPMVAGQVVAVLNIPAAQRFWEGSPTSAAPVGA
ncbi:hypothetical protein ACFXPS_38735 [Nocardia sp. NPDC059091]